MKAYRHYLLTFTGNSGFELHPFTWICFGGDVFVVRWNVNTKIIVTIVITLICSICVCRKYLDELEGTFEEDLEVTKASYEKEKKIAALAEENRQIQLKHEKQQKENAEKMRKLERETITTAAKLEETRRMSKEREDANQKQLDKIAQQMKEARAEDRAVYEKEAERWEVLYHGVW